MMSLWVLHSPENLEMKEANAGRRSEDEGAGLKMLKGGSGFWRFERKKVREFEKSGSLSFKMNKKRGIYRRLVGRSIDQILKFEIAQSKRLRAMICFRKFR